MAAAETRQPGVRIARRIARAGVCSRREAEKLIAEGRVAVNGETITSPALNVGESDKITVDGKALATAEPTRLWLYHKPKGRITTTRDPEGRPTIFDDLPGTLPRVITIGRLDFNTEGLLLLTNDGDLARTLELPANAWERCYRVRVYGRVDEDALARLAKGIEIDGIRYGAIIAQQEKPVRGTNSWLTITLREGKNREIRKVLEHLGLSVTRLIRVSYGPFQLAKLEPGMVMEVPGKTLTERLSGKKEKTGKPKKPGGKRRAHRRRSS